MKIIVGSLNPVKIGALEEAFAKTSFLVSGAAVDSKVRDQPLSHEETRQGAINRARACVKEAGADLGFGLEGGVFISEGLLYLCSWGALADKEETICVVSGPTFRLPDAFKKPLLDGFELNDVMFNVMGIKELGSKEGAIGHFTKGVTNRREVFKQMAQILWGQYQYGKELSFS
jgi:inosine/xanthosine triphosphatase